MARRLHSQHVRHDRCGASMGHGTFDGMTRADFDDLVADMGSATPVPVFFVDEAGHAHALNLLAETLPEDHDASEALLSPIAPQSGRHGHVVAYVDPAHARDSEVVAAMVALTAEIVGRRLVPAPESHAALSPREASIEIALARLSEVAETEAIARIVADAASAVTAAERVVVFALGDDAVLEPRAARGMAEPDVRSAGSAGLIGWAARRGCSTVVASPHRLPAGAPRDEGRHGPLATWLAPPFALIPLTSGAHVVGLLCVSGLAPVAGRDPAKQACERLERLAEKAGSALAGALMVQQARREERVHREIEIARQIQARLLTSRAVTFPGLQLAGECRAAAQVGGDWFGFRAAGEDALVASLFDVAGHGIGAAFCMTLVRSALLAELSRAGSPADTLARANELVAEDFAESGLFATAFLARFDRTTGLLAYASAGHSRPVHWSARERRFTAHREAGLPLGLMSDARYPDASVPFGENDLLVLYTDGIVEAENAACRQFGRDRLMGIVRRLRSKPASIVLKVLWNELERFTGSRALRDDATLVVVRGAKGFGPRDENARGRAGRGEVQADVPAPARRDRRIGAHCAGSGRR